MSWTECIFSKLYGHDGKRRWTNWVFYLSYLFHVSELVQFVPSLGVLCKPGKGYWTNTVIYYDAENLFQQVGTDVKLMSMVKAVNTEAPIWYAQVSVSLNIMRVFSPVSETLTVFGLDMHLSYSRSAQD